MGFALKWVPRPAVCTRSHGVRSWDACTKTPHEYEDPAFWFQGENKQRGSQNHGL